MARPRPGRGMIACGVVVPGGWQTQYVLFAREGFTDALQAYANSIDAILVPLDQVESTLI
jgi:hypothetical protein